MNYQEWVERVAVNDSDSLTDDDLAESWQWSQTFGPPNCWCGTIGRGAWFVRMLLLEIKRLRAINA